MYFNDFTKKYVEIDYKKKKNRDIGCTHQKIDFMQKFVKLDVQKQMKYVQSIREKIVKLTLQKRVKK